MKKIYELVIGTDVLPFFAYDCDESGALLNPAMESKAYAFENGARVVDISDLDYIPAKQSNYIDGTFNHGGDPAVSSVGDALAGTRRFAYVLDNVVYGTSILQEDDGGPMSALIAALQSSPQIRFSRLE